MIYIMKRTQLYLNDDIWETLHIRARQQRTTISELVRQAVRERYSRSSKDRRQAMQALVGIWKNRRDLADSTAYVRSLRRGSRLKRIAS